MFLNTATDGHIAKFSAPCLEGKEVSAKLNLGCYLTAVSAHWTLETRCVPAFQRVNLVVTKMLECVQEGNKWLSMGVG